ncbi:MAG: DUF4296 domain-containing protein [Candidatus Limisoma sp.]|nr:DUF4296 domain-containing protein [Bacteroidales bacterium]MDY5893225.1 DUF4296 domain-containing protein [Candidatus Limisoma sp.]
MKHLSTFIATALLLLTAACSKTPDGVIGQSDMADLLADMQVADAIVEINRDSYEADSSRLNLRRSVLKRHGITEDEFDSSLVWYGHNLDVYKEVYDKVVTKLEDRQQDIIEEARRAGEKMTASGDSIDIWQAATCYFFDRRRCGNSAQINFSIDADINTKPGDKYEWRMTMKNASNGGYAMLAVDYDDGSWDYTRRSLRPDEAMRLKLQTDSTLTVKRVYGYVAYTIGSEDAIFADSLSLYRSRLDPTIYFANKGTRRRLKKQ